MQHPTSSWVRKAEADRIAAERLAGAKPAVHDAVCFHCQQCAEKYLKALLNAHLQRLPRTHDLTALMALAEVHYPSLVKLQRGLQYLTQFAVEARLSRPVSNRSTSRRRPPLGDESPQRVPSIAGAARVAALGLSTLTGETGQSGYCGCGRFGLNSD